MEYDADLVACVCETVAQEAGVDVDQITTETPLDGLGLSRLAPHTIVLSLEQRLRIETDVDFETQVFGGEGATIGTLVRKVAILGPEIRKEKPRRPRKGLGRRIAEGIQSLPVMKALVPRG